MRSFPLVALFAVASAGLSPSAARAHRMDVEVTDDGRTLRVVVGYDDGTPAEGATVTLATAADDVVRTAATDEKGVCEFPRPPAGAYRVTARDDLGHKAS